MFPLKLKRGELCASVVGFVRALRSRSQVRCSCPCLCSPPLFYPTQQPGDETKALNYPPTPPVLWVLVFGFNTEMFALNFADSLVQRQKCAE